MKALFFLLWLLPAAGAAQTYALLDRDFKRPLIVTDAITTDLMHDRRFPVYTKDIDSLISFTERLQKHMNTGKTYDEATVRYDVGGSWFMAQREKIGKVNKYHITINTRAQDVGASLELVSDTDGSKAAAQKVNIFLDYLRNNRLLIEQALSNPR